MIRFLVIFLMMLLGIVPAQAKLKVVASIQILGKIAQEVAGDQIEVITLASGDQDPHFVDPKPSFILDLKDADLVLYNGAELEDAWFLSLLSNSRNPELQIGSMRLFNASQYVQLLEVPNQVDRAQGDIHGSGNPHFLYDMRAIALVAKALGERFAQIDPQNMNAYISQSKAKAEQYERFAQIQRARFFSLPSEKRQLISYHRSLSYLLDWLQIQSPIQLEPKLGLQPSPAHILQVLSLMKARKIHVVMQERYYIAQYAQNLINLVKGDLIWFETGVKGDESIEKYFENQLDQLYLILQK
jgi:zinc/manganese transport system substrate-binding protein